MEFTFDGVVRQGFGFFNPNHAAAFFCAVLPFAFALCFSKKFWIKILGILFAVALVFATAFTFSRAGIFVAVFEIVAFAVFFKKENFMPVCCAIAALIAAIVFSGAYSRFAYDAAASNRLEIWKNGLCLLFQNPFGVGLGNSGEIVSAFMLPEGVSCRTLVNSHLTFACEYGVFAAAVYFGAIISALVCGMKRVKASRFMFCPLVSMAGFLISATFSSVFDLEPVFHPERFDGFSFANILCLRLNFILFMLVFGFVFARFFDKKIFAASLLLSSMIFISAYAVFPKSAPKIRKLCGKTFIAAAETPMRRAAFWGDDSTLKSAVKILKKLDLMDGTFICANSFQNEESLPPLKDADSIILFGSISEFAGGKGAENCKFILISPPAHIRHAESGYEIYLPKRNAYSKGGFINCGKIKYF